MKKIPDNAKLVFKGVLHDVYHWDQEMFDGTTATFEAIRRRDAVVVVAVVDSKIILNHEEQPGMDLFITLPGGNSETSDFMEDAKRELLEETGYASDAWVRWFTVDILDYHKMEWNNNFFIARNCKKIAELDLENGEKIVTQLITFEEFLELRHNPDFRNKDLLHVLEKAAENEEERQKLKELLGITN
jgi:ADP-ribose pyrophosphatase